MSNEELIDAYFEGKLTAEEQAMFDARLERDAPFRQEVLFHQQVRAATALNEREAWKEKMQGWEAQLPPLAKPAVRQMRWWYMAAAASLIAFVVASVIWFAAPDGEKLYAAYFTAYPNTVAPTVRSATTDNAESKAFYAYDNEDYAAADSLFKKAYRIAPQPHFLFYRAVSLMQLKNFSAAATLLQQEEVKKDSRFGKAAAWYLSLCYLPLQQQEKAIPLLQSLQQSETYGKQAAELLAALKE